MPDKFDMRTDIMAKLAAIIRDRKTAPQDRSYTRQLLDQGPQHCARKFGEEAVETVVAALAQDADAVRAEAADVLYHLLVLLESRGVDYGDVLNVLADRMGVSGLDEKAARRTD